MNKRLLFVGSAVVALAVAAGCGGGGSSTSPLPQSPANNQTKSAQGTVTLTIPRASGATATSKRSPEYISTNTHSFSVQVGTGTPTVTDVDTLTACTGTPLTCTVDFTGIVGANTVTIKTYSSTDASGTALSQNSTSIVLQSGTNAPVSLTLNPVVATQVVTITSPDPAAITADGTTQNLAVSYSLEDSTGAIVVLAEGSLVDSNGNALPTNNPVLVPAPTSGITVGTYTGDSASGTWAPTFDTSQGNANVAFSVAAISGTNIAAANATLTVTATPAPSPSASASPSESPSASPSSSSGPTNAIVNGTFATGDLTGWYTCYATHTQLSAPVNPTATQYNSGSQGTSSVAPTTAPSTTDATVQTAVPSGAAPPSTDSHFALVGYSDTAATGKGQSGICQDVTVPSGTATLSFNVYEGGNDDFANADVEADVYPAGSFATANGAMQTTASPSATLFADNNCYDNLQNNALYLVAPWGTGTHSVSTTGRYKACPYFPNGVGDPSGAPDGTDISLGGIWYSPTFDVSAYGGTNVTVFLGVYRKAGSATGSSGSPGYYIYAYFDNVSLTATSGCSVGKRGAQSTNGKRTPRC